MRLAALLASLAAALASGGAIAWWSATGVMRLATRWLERSKPLRVGPLALCAAVLFAVALAVAALAVALARAVFGLLLTVPNWIGVERGWLVALWHVLLALAAVLLAAAGVWAAFREALAALGAARRRWFMTDPRAGWPDPVPEPGPVPGAATSGGRAIVILCDGTRDRANLTEDGAASATNIWKLSEALVCDEAQTTWYQAGVGSDTSSTAAEARRTRTFLAAVGANPGAQAAAFLDRVVQVVESTFGTGISESITNGYAEIVRQYRPGDRIYLVGFSRGAYAARCIAGVIARCGLLRAENLRYAPQMVELYRTRRDPGASVAVRPDLLHADPAVEFVGVFDTVASLGVPLWGWWFRALPIWKNAALETDPASVCRHVYHALAMDERHSQYVPTLYDDPRRPGHGRRSVADKLETLEQVWFRGDHGDIGGGYAQHELSDISLGWMMEAMTRHGLRFHEGARRALQPDPLGRLHDDVTRVPGWVLLGTWPRWCPAPGLTPDVLGTTLHPGVLARAAKVAALTGRPDFVRLRTGEALSFVAEAQRDWDRTGLVVEHGALYRLTYQGRLWRDSDWPRCGPVGQAAQGVLDLRRWFTAGRRLRSQPWMRLAATVAHPQRWPLREKGLRELLALLFHNDPAALTRQLAPLGADLARPGDAILLRNEAPSGLLYLFANDWWQTASNNGGGVQLELARVEPGEARLPMWTLRMDGGWVRSEG